MAGEQQLPLVCCAPHRCARWLPRPVRDGAKAVCWLWLQTYVRGANGDGDVGGLFVLLICLNDERGGRGVEVDAAGGTGTA